MIPNMFKIAGELTPAVHPRLGAHDSHARALDLRRPQRRHARAHDRLGDARLGLGAGGPGPGAHRARGHAARAGPVPPLLRRVPHLARDREHRPPQRRRPAGAGAGRRDPRLPRPRPDPGRAAGARHRAEPRRLLPGPRGGQPLLPRHAGHRRRGHGGVRRAHRAPLRARGVRGPAGRGARRRPHGIRRRRRPSRRWTRWPPTARRSAS